MTRLADFESAETPARGASRQIILVPRQSLRRRLMAPAGPQPIARRRRGLRIAILSCLLGVFIISHGCHGDDVDDELSALPSHRVSKPKVADDPERLRSAALPSAAAGP
jgi:hypothetical protein